MNMCAPVCTISVAIGAWSESLRPSPPGGLPGPLSSSCASRRSLSEHSRALVCLCTMGAWVHGRAHGLAVPCGCVLNDCVVCRLFVCLPVCLLRDAVGCVVLCSCRYNYWHSQCCLHVSMGQYYEEIM